MNTKYPEIDIVEMSDHRDIIYAFMHRILVRLDLVSQQDWHHIHISAYTLHEILYEASKLYP
jgi:hypothetical protein